MLANFNRTQLQIKPLPAYLQVSSCLFSETKAPCRLAVRSCWEFESLIFCWSSSSVVHWPVFFWRESVCCGRGGSGGSDVSYGERKELGDEVSLCSQSELARKKQILRAADHWDRSL